MIDNPAVCVICRRTILSTPLQVDRMCCDNCARLTGNIVLPPPRRRASPCAKCNHTKLVRVVPRELSVSPTMGHPTYGPMFATYELRIDDGVVEPLHPRSGFGVLEAYICKKCGFIEWYCQAPEEVPIGPAYMTEEIDTEGETPFR